MAISKLTEAEILAELSSLSEWTVRAGKLHRQLTFADFSSAFAFMAAAALYSEKHDHHPEWSNVYNKVSIDLTTHECGGISKRDFEWARAINKILEARIAR